MRRFFVAMQPTGKERPRMGRNGVYTPPKTQDYERLIAGVYQNSHGSEKPFDGEVSMRIDVWCPMPKSTPKTVESIPYTVTPDADNIAKLCMDSLNGLAYTDDAIINRLVVVKNDRDRKPTRGLLIELEGTYVG